MPYTGAKAISVVKNGIRNENTKRAQQKRVLKAFFVVFRKIKQLTKHTLPHSKLQ
jgi:hypothetical protein